MKPLCNLLEKNAVFDFDDSCWQAFELIKVKLTIAPIMVAPYWEQAFEIIYDASDYSVGAIFRQRCDKIFWAIYYSSRTIDSLQ